MSTPDYITIKTLWQVHQNTFRLDAYDNMQSLWAVRGFVESKVNLV